VILLVNEVNHILRNCSDELKWEDVIKHVEYFVKRMQFSGYTKDFRYKVVKKALTKCDRGKVEAQQGTEPQKAKKGKKFKWYGVGERCDSVVLFNLQ
jgi:hypothetical protein